MSRPPVIGHMCKTDYDHELGCASDGSVLRTAFTVPTGCDGSICLACSAAVMPGEYHECWSELASADTHPKDGDSTQIEAPLVSGAVPPQAGDAQ